VYPS